MPKFENSLVNLSSVELRFPQSMFSLFLTLTIDPQVHLLSLHIIHCPEQLSQLLRKWQMCHPPSMADGT